jgi:hypothetical protein
MNAIEWCKFEAIRIESTRDKSKAIWQNLILAKIHNERVGWVAQGMDFWVILAKNPQGLVGGES